MNSISTLTSLKPVLACRPGRETSLSLTMRLISIAVGFILSMIGLFTLNQMSSSSHTYREKTTGSAMSVVGLLCIAVGLMFKGIATSRTEERAEEIYSAPLHRSLLPSTIPQAHHNSSSTDRSQNPTERMIEAFLSLKNKSIVWLGPKKIRMEIGPCIGYGGSKRAMKLSEKIVLMLPQSDMGFFMWKRMVEEEVRLSLAIRTLGLYSVDSKRVDLYLSPQSDIAMPVYVSSSFKSLVAKNMFVIDIRNRESSCSTGKAFLPDEADRYDLVNWLPIVSQLMRDVYLLARYNLPLNADSLNLVLIKNSCNEYTPRYFGFDLCRSNIKFDFDATPRTAEEAIRAASGALPGLLSSLFYEQNDYDTKRKNPCLPEAYRQLSEQLAALFPFLL